MQQQTRVFEFSSGAQEGAAGTLRFDVTEVSRTALRMFKTKLQTRFDRMRVPLCNLRSHALAAALRYHRP